MGRVVYESESDCLRGTESATGERTKKRVKNTSKETTRPDERSCLSLGEPLRGSCLTVSVIYNELPARNRRSVINDR
jgi:hypothetical protein